MKPRLGSQISIRLGDEDVAQLDRLEREFRGVIAKTNLARAAMRLGLTELEHDRTLIASAVAEPEKRKAAVEAAGVFVDAATEERIARRVVELHGKTLKKTAGRFARTSSRPRRQGPGHRRDRWAPLGSCDPGRGRRSPLGSAASVAPAENDRHAACLDPGVARRRPRLAAPRPAPSGARAGRGGGCGTRRTWSTPGQRAGSGSGAGAGRSGSGTRTRTAIRSAETP
jgi:hypothetical protein